jgi:hypothetical protein
MVLLLMLLSRPTLIRLLNHPHNVLTHRILSTISLINMISTILDPGGVEGEEPEATGVLVGGHVAAVWEEAAAETVVTDLGTRVGLSAAVAVLQIGVRRGIGDNTGCDLYIPHYLQINYVYCSFVALPCLVHHENKNYDVCCSLTLKVIK